MTMMKHPSVFILILLLLGWPSHSHADEKGSSCFLEKGERGFPGYTGPPGTRGHKGEMGEEGKRGGDGDKGDQGPRGPPGPQGKQGPAGVIGLTGSSGPPGSQGPPGNTGIQGPTGSQGPKGQKGFVGLKGEKGVIGPRGQQGLDGTPGPPGHLGSSGPRGFKGDKGQQGLPGHKGERGPQGITGPEMSDETLKTYFAPVKLLQQEVSQMKKRLGTKKPMAHLRGNSAHQSLSRGTTVTYWSPSFLEGGMTYRNGELTVLQSGIYYIFAQLWVTPTSSNSGSGFRLFVNSSPVARIYSGSPARSQFTQYSGVLWKLQKGDTIKTVIQYMNRYYFGSTSSYFGAWKVD